MKIWLEILLRVKNRQKKTLCSCATTAANSSAAGPPPIAATAKGPACCSLSSNMLISFQKSLGQLLNIDVWAHEFRIIRTSLMYCRESLLYFSASRFADYTISTESCTIRCWRVSGANFVKALKAIDDRKTNFSRVYLRNGRNVMLDQVRSKWWNCRSAWKWIRLECIFFWKTLKLHENSVLSCSI